MGVARGYLGVCLAAALLGCVPEGGADGGSLEASIPDGGLDAGPGTDAGPTPQARRCELEVTLIASDQLLHRELRVPRISRGETYYFGRGATGELQLYVDDAAVLSGEEDLDVDRVGAFTVGELLADRFAIGRYEPPCERVHRVAASLTLRDYPGLGGPPEESVLAQLRFSPTTNPRAQVLAVSSNRIGTDELETLSSVRSSACGVHVFGASLAAGGSALFAYRDTLGITRVLGQGDTLPGTTETATRASLEVVVDTAALVRVTTTSGESLWRVPHGGTPTCVAGPPAFTGCVVTMTALDRVVATHDETALTGTALDGRETLWRVPDVATAPQPPLSFDSEPRFRSFADLGYDTSTGDLYFLGRLDGPNDVWVVRADGGAIERLTDFFTTLGGVVPVNLVGPRRMSVGPRGWLSVVTENDRVEGIYARSPDGRLARGPREGDSLPIDRMGGEAVIDRFAMARGSAGEAGAIEDGELVFQAISDDGRVGIYRARLPDDDCVPEADVNTIDDRADASPGDGRCDTGITRPDGEPECSLRAAIEEANASPGPARIRFALEPGARVIRPDPELPEITSPVTIDGEDHGVTLDGRDAGDVSGLSCLTDEGCEIRGLTIQGFGRHGVYSAGAELRLVDVEVADQCGWGVYAEGSVRAERSEITGNGVGGGCEAGGLYAASTDRDLRVRLVSTRVEDNGGPGVLTSHAAVLEAATIARNAGEGLSIWSRPATGTNEPDALRVENGASVIEGNRGHGVYVDRGPTVVEPSGSIALRDNGGWGLFASSGPVRFGEAGPGEPTATSEVTGNGVGTSCSSWALAFGSLLPERTVEPCGGGGLFSASARDSFLEATRIQSNDGPGVLLAARLRLERGVEVRENRGSGVVVAAPVGEPLPSVSVSVELGAPTLADNHGYGIEAAAGDVVVDRVAGVIVERNLAGGIDAVDDVRIGADPAPPVTPERRIASNGGGVTCHAWTIDDTDLRPRDDGEGPCPAGAGIRTDRAASVFGRDLVCRDNAGDGVETGDIDLASARLCGNGDRPIDATGAQSLVDVAFTCP